MLAKIVLGERKKGFFSSKKLYQVGIVADFTEQEKSLFKMNPGIATLELLSEPLTQAGELLSGGVMVEFSTGMHQRMAQDKFTNGLKYLINALNKAGADGNHTMDYGPQPEVADFFKR